MRRLAALPIVVAFALSVDVSEAETPPTTTTTALTAKLVAARRAGGVTTAYSTGPMSYEVEIENLQPKATGLTTNLIVEMPPAQNGGQLRLATIPINVPGLTKRWITFTHPTGFDKDACGVTTFWLRLENGAASPVTIQSRPRCSFSVSGTTYEAAINLTTGYPGKLWTFQQANKTPITCSTGVEVTTMVRNQTTSKKDFGLRIGGSGYGASSWQSLNPGYGLNVTLKSGGYPYFKGRTGSWKLMITSNLLSATPSTDPEVRQPLYGFSLARSCQPYVSLLAGKVIP